MGAIVAFHIKNDDKGEMIVREWRKVLDSPTDFDGMDGDFESRRYSNPVAYHVDKTAHEVVEYLFSEDNEPTIPESVDDLCRLKALQDPVPSSALSPFSELRTIVFSRIGSADADSGTMTKVDKRIDACLLHAMDYYCQCREQIMQLRVDEIKRREKTLERQMDSYLANSRKG